MYQVFDEIGLLANFETYEEALEFCGGMEFEIIEVDIDWEALF